MADTAVDWVYFRSEDRPEGGFLPRAEVRVSPLDRGFMLADGVYEVIRSYQGRLFHADRHLSRLAQSLAATGIEFEDTRALGAVAAELIRRNGLDSTDATVYIQVTRGICPRSLLIPAEGLLPTVYADASKLTVQPEQAEQGIRAITVPDIRWQRCDIKSIALLPNVLARLEADRRGAEEALFVRDGLLTEGTHTSLFGVRAGAVFTHPLSGSILAGVTRSVVLELCAGLGIPSAEQAILAAGLAGLDELFLSCTTAEVLPVTAVNGMPVGSGTPGPVTRRLLAAFREHVDRALAGA